MNGRGWFRWHWVRPEMSSPSGYTYIGPCRCGMGPHAYYQDQSGRIVHAWHLYHGSTPPIPLSQEDLKTELAILKNEKERLEERIKELEMLMKKGKIGDTFQNGKHFYIPKTKYEQHKRRRTK